MLHARAAAPSKSLGADNIAKKGHGIRPAEARSDGIGMDVSPTIAAEGSRDASKRARGVGKRHRQKRSKLRRR
jgi:hypothetical protein